MPCMWFLSTLAILATLACSHALTCLLSPSLGAPEGQRPILGPVVLLRAI